MRLHSVRLWFITKSTLYKSTVIIYYSINKCGRGISADIFKVYRRSSCYPLEGLQQEFTHYATFPKCQEIVEWCQSVKTVLYHGSHPLRMCTRGDKAGFGQGERFSNVCRWCDVTSQIVRRRTMVDFCQIRLHILRRRFLNLELNMSELQHDVGAIKVLLWTFDARFLCLVTLCWKTSMHWIWFLISTSVCR